MSASTSVVTRLCFRCHCCCLCLVTAVAVVALDSSVL